MRLLGELTRFGGAALANTLFGYGAYAALVAAGLHPLAAQLAAQVAGTVFNMRTYAVAFRRPAARGRFVLAYLANYLVSLALLAGFTRLADPYTAGLLALLVAAAINFAVLRGFVFARKPLPGVSRPLVVTGATGWIGRALLAEAGARALRLFGSAAGEVDGVAVRPLDGITGADVEGADVAHLAFLTLEKAALLGAAAFTATNEAIDGHLLRALAEARPHALFVASSGAARDGAHPYGRAKLRQERAFLDWGTGAGVPVLAGRIFALAGPHINKLDSYAVGSFVHQALTTATIRITADRPVFRSYLHVGDLARLILAALDAGEGAPDPLDLCGSEVMEMADLARLVAAACGLPPESIQRPPLRFDEGANAYLGDPLGLRLLALRLGLAPRDPATQVADTVAWLRAR